VNLPGSPGAAQPDPVSGRVAGGDLLELRQGIPGDLLERCLDASERFAFLGAFVGADNPTSSEVTRKLPGWDPEHPGLIEDLEHGHYFG
jgi:hypothetical protein